MVDFSKEYDLNELCLIRPIGQNFEMFVTPRYRSHYENTAYESFTADFLKRILSRTKLFVDIGAHYGYFSLLASLSNPKLEVISAEPIVESHAVLIKNIQHLSITNIKTYQYAIADSAGEATFLVSLASDNCSFYPHPSAPPIGSTQVKTTTIDRLLEDHEISPIVIKIDTDGHELAVLRGMAKTRQRFTDISLIIEFNPKMQRAASHEPEELLQELDRQGFAIFLLDDNKRRSYRLKPDTDWSQLMNAESYANLYCVPKSRALSLCFVSHSSGLCGAERSLLSVVDYLISDHGALCSVILPTNGPLVSKLEEVGASCIIDDYNWWAFSSHDKLTSEIIHKDIAVGCLSFLNKFYLSIRQIDPDIIWTQTLVIPWGALLAAMLQKPHVWSVCEFGERDHELSFWFPFEEILKEINASSHLIYTCSDAVSSALFPSMPSSKCKTLHRYIDIPSSFTKSDVSHYKIKGALKLAIFATVCSGKGQLDIVRAAIVLCERNYNIELLLLGSNTNDEYVKHLSSLIENAGVEDRVRLVGTLSNPYACMQEADVIVACSRNEAFGRVVLEAMLLGKAVVYTDSGAFPEYMLDGQTGLMYPADDVAVLVEKLEILANDEAYRHNLGRFAQGHAIRKFTKENFSGMVFQDLLNLNNQEVSTIPLPASIYKIFFSALVESFQNFGSQQCLDTALIEKLNAQQQAGELAFQELSQSSQAVELELKIIKNSVSWKIILLLKEIINKIPGLFTLCRWIVRLMKMINAYLHSVKKK